MTVADLPKINWDGTTWSDVQAYADANATPGFDWPDFWNKILWFGEPPDKLYRDVKSGAQTYVADPLARAGDAIASDFTGAVSETATNAAGNAWSAAAPYVAVGGLVLLAYAVVKAR